MAVSEARRRLEAENRGLRQRVEKLEDVLGFVECNDCDAGGVGDHAEPDCDCPGDRNIRIARKALHGEDEDD